MPRLATIDIDIWEPPPELLDLIDKKKHRMYQRDRIELIVAFYASEHGGNSPTFECMGKILKCGRSNAFLYAMELTRDDQRRAVRRNGKFWLVNSQYTHPVIKEKFPTVIHDESDILNSDNLVSGATTSGLEHLP